jgi:alpha-galactosidase
MGSHVGPRASHTTARTASLTMRAMTALFGHMGTEADLRDFTPAERTALAEAFALYKQHRGWMHAGSTVRLSHPDPGCLATALAGEGRMLVSAAQVATPLTAGLSPLRLTGLDPAATYAVSQIKPPARARATMRRVPPLTRGETLLATGAMLGHTGLSLPVLRAGEIAVFLLVRED